MTTLRLPKDFRFSGIVGGLRSEPNRRDIALIVSDRPAASAGVFTSNLVCAAPVKVSKARVPRADARGIIVCSGNANACTGEQGIADAVRMTELAAKGIGCTAEQVLVASTGVIGRPMPMAILEAGIPKASAALREGYDALSDAAHAILTTDTRIKTSSRTVEGYTVFGFAKGAAMIGPNLATMLGFVLTDAPISPDDLQQTLRVACDDSFNCVSVEGHESTNDTVFALANGAAGGTLNPEIHQRLKHAIREVCADLARQIAQDAEGAKHLITLEVEGCRTNAEARKIAKTIAESALVKTAVYGADPNWGRVVSAAGYSGVRFEEKDLTLRMGDMTLYEQGCPLPFDAAKASSYLRENVDVVFRLTFANGPGKCTFFTCDLTPEYVALNADYTT